MTVEPCVILHVEHDSEIRMLVAMSLSLDDCMIVRSVGSAEEACAELEREDEIMPSGIILDYMVGRTSGIDLLRRIREIAANAEIPALFLTSRLMTRETSAMIGAGAAGILSKPFNPLTLALDVKRLVGC